MEEEKDERNLAKAQLLVKLDDPVDSQESVEEPYIDPIPVHDAQPEAEAEAGHGRVLQAGKGREALSPELPLTGFLHLKHTQPKGEKMENYILVYYKSL